MDYRPARYHGHDGERTATFPTANEPPGYTTSKGTAEQYRPPRTRPPDCAADACGKGSSSRRLRIGYGRTGRREAARAMTGSTEFSDVIVSLRRELLAYCYRMVGSIDEAEDLVQETYLRAWRAYGDFEGRASVRTWLYRIATNVCLTAIARRGRRPLPSGLGAPSTDPDVPLVAGAEVAWLQPYPDLLVGAVPDDPATVAASRAGIRLAFVAALQYLSARPRAVLILRDVLQWPASDVADLLGMTPTAVHSALRRARADLARSAPVPEELVEPTEVERRAVVERFASAIERADAAAVAKLLRADAVLEMPPLLTWFAGRDAVARFVDVNLLVEPDRLRAVHTQANSQDALAVYQRGADGTDHAHAIIVLTLTGRAIARMVVFQDPGLFTAFGLPVG
jgi:RNA polymerase sigma-70 factor, ECF subfamily